MRYISLVVYSCTLMVHIVQKDAQLSTNNIHRVVWCPFLPDEDDCDDDNSTLLVLTHGSKGKFFDFHEKKKKL